jgi:hypothetical protein
MYCLSILYGVITLTTGNLVASGDHGVLMVEYQLYHRQSVEQTRCPKPKHLIFHFPIITEASLKGIAFSNCGEI